MLNVVLAVVLILVSLIVIFYVLGLVLGALHPGAWLERWHLRRYIARARRGDRFLDAGEVDQALTSYERALYPYPARTRELADAIRRHHTGLLSRLLATADQVQDGAVRLMSLARADRLFQQRENLQRQYLARRSSAGSRHRVRQELDSNTKDLRAALASLAEEIRSARTPERTH